MSVHSPAAQAVDPLAGGVGRSGLVAGGKIPPQAVRAQGCRVLDDTGRWLIDAHNNFTVLMHGHAHPGVTNAVDAVLRDGAVCVGLPTAHERQLAEVIAERVASVEQVRFANSGTEAVQTAIRLARAWTGGSTVIGVVSAFHGSSEPALVIQGGNYTLGVTSADKDSVRRVPLNDIAALEAEVDACGNDLAVILIDLMANYTGLVKLTDEFVSAARRLCDERNAVLIFDEVVSLRHELGGLQAHYGAQPDLTIMGKIIGGGLPIGAIGGHGDIMRLLDPTKSPSVFSSGTFTGNPVTMAAGLACLQAYDAEAIRRINELGDRLRARVQAAALPGWNIRGYGSLARMYRADGSAAPADFFWKMLDAGVLVTPAGLVALSTPMDEDVIDEIADRLLSVAADLS